MSEEFNSIDDFPKAKFQRAGNKFVSVVLRWSNGETSAETYRKQENVDEVVEAVKDYESKRQNACERDVGWAKDCERATVNSCECLKDSYENLMNLLEPYKRYEVEGLLEKDNQGNYYLGGYNTPIPEEMADLIVEHYEDDLSIDHLVEFWKKMLLNPNEQAREDLFEYISDHGITITDNGYMLLYKAVTTKNKRVPDDDLAQFVGAEYLKRKNWGKNPADYHVHHFNGEFVLENHHTISGYHVSSQDGETLSASPQSSDATREYLGTLEELFEDRDKLSRGSETVMTDKHTRTFEYNLGEDHSMPREECDSNPSRGCSRGLHVGSESYVSSFGHSPTRDIIQAVLVNPMHVVAIPNHDNSKIRTCEFFSYGIMERDEDGVWHEIENQYFEDDYEAMEEEALEERLDNLEVSSPAGNNTESDQIKAAQQRLVDLRNN